MLLWLNSCPGESCRASLSLQPVSATTFNHQGNWSGDRDAVSGIQKSYVALD